jgi:hypothetical protein
MRSFLQIKNKSHLSILFSSYAVGVTLMLLLFGSVIMTNIAYGQIFPNTHDNATSATNPTSSSSTSQKQPIPSPPLTSLPNLHLVKIISPIKGQQVPDGDNLMISGTSADNTTSDCKVSVIVNGVKPYHDAFPSGQNGQSDYSKWNFALTPTYTSIKEGQNKITSKFSCGNDPSLISHNSVNVTGAAATDIAATASNDNGSSQQQSQQQISSTAILPPHIIAADLNSTSANSTATADSTSPIPSDATGANGGSTNDSNLKTLSVSLHLAMSSLHPGDKQIIAIKVADKNSTDAVGGASVSGRITSPSGLVKKLEGTTDDKGKTSYSWKVSDRYATGKYKLKIEVSAIGYDNYSGSKTFKVTPIPVAVSNDNPISSSISSPVHTTSSNDNTIPLPGPVNVPGSSLFTSDNTDSHHHPHHDHTSTIISSTSTDTIPNDNNIPSNSDNANTDTNTNNKGHNHHSTIIPSTAHNTDNNTNTNNEQQTRSNTGGERDININSNGLSSSISLGSASSSSNTIGTNTDKNTGGLAQKIINNVKNKLEMRGIHLP